MITRFIDSSIRTRRNGLRCRLTRALAGKSSNTTPPSNPLHTRRESLTKFAIKNERVDKRSQYINRATFYKKETLSWLLTTRQNLFENGPPEIRNERSSKKKASAGDRKS